MAISSARRMLVVEDDELYRANLCALLDLRFTAEIVATTNIADTHKYLAESHVLDVAVLDVKLPPHALTRKCEVTGGFGLAGEIKRSEKWRSLPVLLLTAFDSFAGEFVELCRQGTQGLGYVIKSAPTHEIVAALREIMNGGHYSRPLRRLDRSRFR